MKIMTWNLNRAVGSRARSQASVINEIGADINIFTEIGDLTVIQKSSSDQTRYWIADGLAIYVSNGRVHENDLKLCGRWKSCTWQPESGPEIIVTAAHLPNRMDQFAKECMNMWLSQIKGHRSILAGDFNVSSSYKRSEFTPLSDVIAKANHVSAWHHGQLPIASYGGEPGTMFRGSQKAYMVDYIFVSSFYDVGATKIMPKTSVSDHSAVYSNGNIRVL